MDGLSSCKQQGSSGDGVVVIGGRHLDNRAPGEQQFLQLGSIPVVEVLCK